jgi:hypothetical protein
VNQDHKIRIFGQHCKRVYRSHMPGPGVTISEIPGSELGWWSSEEPGPQNLKILLSVASTPGPQNLKILLSVASTPYRSHMPGPGVTISEIPGSELGWWSSEEPGPQNLKILISVASTPGPQNLKILLSIASTPIPQSHARPGGDHF